MKITQELIQIIHDRVREVCIAKYNVDPHSIILEEDYFRCEYTPHYNYADTETYTISVEDLQIENLDNLIADRKQQERIAAEKRAEDNRITTEKRLEREKQERQAQYEKLKKEFNP